MTIAITEFLITILVSFGWLSDLIVISMYVGYEIMS